VSVVWVGAAVDPDGDELVSAHLSEYQKTRNIRRDPRVAVTHRGKGHPGSRTPYLFVTGTARIVEVAPPSCSPNWLRPCLGPASTSPRPMLPRGC